MASFLDPLGTGATTLDGLDGEAATCSDGIQNQGETGVDCGGPECPECPPCLDNELTLEIVFDDYPQDISWSLKNSAGTTIAFDGNFGAEYVGSTIFYDMCLPDDCYDLIILDSYGDGLCCNEGIGSYSLSSSSGDVLASGGAFGSGETTNFCLDSDPPTDCTVFESAPVDLTKSFDPVNGIQDRVQVKWFKDSPQVRYSIEDNAACDIEYWAYRYRDDEFSPWVNIPEAQRDTSRLPYTTVKKTNNKPLFKWPLKFRLPSGVNQVEPNRGYRWRVRCYCEQGALIDGAQVISPWSEVKFFNTPDFDPSTGIYTPPAGIEGEFTSTKSVLDGGDLRIYPNPSDGRSLNIEFSEASDDPYYIEIIDIQGKLIFSDRFQTSKSGTMTIDFKNREIEAGLYFLNLIQGSRYDTHRFVVE
jgi:hypothetical protein